MKKKRNISTILIILVFLAGLSLLLYPTFSEWWNSSRQSRVVATYTKAAEGLDQELAARLLEDAGEFNRDLLLRENQYLVTEEESARYESLLALDQSGVIAYVSIPKINCTLPIYHGTSEGVLQAGVGHVEWSSLPVGGESTHAVLSSHRGLPSAKLFTDLDQLAVGDRFQIVVLNQTLTYEIDQILTVEPDDTQALLVEEGKDYCTLFTCTPYGINTHRLLLRGVRVEDEAVPPSASAQEEESAPPAASQPGEENRAPAVGMELLPPLLCGGAALVVFILLLASLRRRRAEDRKDGRGQGPDTAHAAKGGGRRVDPGGAKPAKAPRHSRGGGRRAAPKTQNEHFRTKNHRGGDQDAKDE